MHSERESDTVFNLGNRLDIQVCTVVGEEEECEVKLYDIPACKWAMSVCRVLHKPPPHFT